MDGPGNYRAAEQLLAQVAETTAHGTWHPALVNANLAAAQVHATLALAAATAINAPMPNPADRADRAAWRKVAGVEEVHS